MIGLIAFGYQRKLWLKERGLRKSEEDIQEYLSNLHENEEKIQQKEILIQSLSLDLEDKGHLEGTIKERMEQIDSLQKDKEYLKSQNNEYQCKIKEYTRAAKQNEDKIVKLEKISAQNLLFKNREAF